jgi:G3E family GTPase
MPVTLLTGFLGSGKTTLLNAALRTATAPIGVVVNEFGAIGVDHDLVEAADEDVMLLAGGCACCALRSDVAEALERLARVRAAAGAPPVERIVIETTGLADPTPIEQLFLAPGAVAARHRLTGVVTAVDACLGAATAEREGAWHRQVALADGIVLTKTDVADAAALAHVTALLDRANPHASRRMGEAGAAWLASEEVPGLHTGGRSRPEWLPVHDTAVASYGLRLREPIEGEVLSDWLDALVAAYGERLLRVKGLVRIEDDDRPLVVHAAQHLVGAPRFLDAWPGADRDTRLAFISRGLEPVDLLLGYAGTERPEWA